MVLVAFGKTDELEPGASQTLTLTVPAEALASYDYKGEGCYVLDEGDYTFYLSDNAHSWAQLTQGDGSRIFTPAPGEGGLQPGQQAPLRPGGRGQPV